MLGIGRASEYANWWNQGLKSVAFTSTSTFVGVIQRPTGYSFATRDTNSGTFISTGISPVGTINLASLTGYTGYNQYRSTNVVHFYPNSASWTGYGDGTYSTARQSFTNSSGSNNNCDIQLQVSGTSLIINTLASGLTLPKPVSTYYDAWMTVAVATAETSSVFTNWTGGTQGGNTVAYRITVWNTLTGALITSKDVWAGNSGLPGNWATQYGTSLSVTQNFANNSYFTDNYGVGADSDTNNPLTPIGGYWYAWGTCFDPISITDTSWLTTCPSSQIGQAIPFIQSQFIGFGNSGSTYYNQSPLGISLYSQGSSNNEDWTSSPTGTHESQMYSNTILVRNT